MIANVEVITPELAQEYLRNRHEHTRRPHNERRHLLFAELMENGEWKNIEGSPIMFDKHDQMIDGVQRMTAIILCGRPVEMYVLRGVPEGGFR